MADVLEFQSGTLKFFKPIDFQIFSHREKRRTQMKRKKNGFEKPIEVKKDYKNSHPRRERPRKNEHQYYREPGKRARQNFQKSAHNFILIPKTL